MRRCNETVYGYITLQRPAGSDTDNIERTQFFIDRSCFEINVCECIEFVENNINIIGAYTCRHDTDFFGSETAGMGYKLSVLLLYLYRIKMFGNFLYPVRISYRYNNVCEFFRP